MRKRQSGMFRNLLYFELNASSYFLQMRLYRLIGFFVSFFLLVVMIGLILLYRKNQEYRRKLVSREQLVRLGEMARILAHEIKNPLGAMRIQTGYLKKLLPDKYIKELFLIDEEIDRLSLLTNRISDFVRDPLGNPEKIVLSRFIRNLLKRFSFTIDFKNSIINDTIVFDRERLRSIIENIINNAIESQQIENAEKSDPVIIELYEENDYIILAVFDRGAGITPEIKEKIFDPFFTTRTQGSGIGLSITKRFLEANNGKIDLYSRNEGGTEVRLYFRRQLED